jgi:hypothetical protein
LFSPRGDYKNDQQWSRHHSRGQHFYGAQTIRKNASFWLDLRIALLTLIFLFTGEHRFEQAVRDAKVLQKTNCHPKTPAERNRPELREISAARGHHRRGFHSPPERERASVYVRSGPTDLPSNRGIPIWVGVDASIKRDSTAIVATTWDKKAQQVRLVTHRVFQPNPDEPLNSKPPLNERCST